MARPASEIRRRRPGLIVFLLAVCLTGPTSWSAAEPAAAPTPDSNAIIRHLNQAIAWYRRVASLDVTAGQPSDALYLESARNSAAQALQLAFQSATAQAALLPASSGQRTANAGAASGGQAGSQPPNIAKAAADVANRVAQTQSQIDDLNKQIARAAGKQRQELLSKRDALQGNLDLDKMIQESLQKIASVSTNNEPGTGLAAQISQLKQAVPEVFAPAASRKETSTSTGQSSKSSRAQNSGLFGQTSILFGQMSDIRDIDQLMSQTTRLRNAAENLDAPLRNSLRSLIQQGREMANQAPSSDPAQIAATRSRFEALTAQFKQVADAAVPLRQEIVLVDQCRGELQEWRNSIAMEYGRVLRSLLLRVAAILLALGFVVFLSVLWRRATYRYIRDVRRRRQLTMVRRFVIGFLMGAVILAGFISEFSSLATFAGFLTAGIAVALQTVILSIAAYFFLIGRYGVRVGDRVTIAGVTGDVIEVGMVRLYLMELAGTGIDLHPTGRVVVFSNSVMFQAAPFFKQLPGTAYAWHEIAITTGPDADLSLLERKLLAAVNSVYSQYRHNIDHQHSLVERILDTSIAAPEPAAKLQFSEAGPELVIRYPVEIQRASQIDDQVTRKVMEIINGDAQLKAAVSATPRLRAPIKA